MTAEPIRKRALDRARKYRMSLEDAFLVDNVRWCQATGRPLGPAKHVDHCHEDMRVRGVLDPVVNRSLAAGLTPEDLRRMATYLERTSDPKFNWGDDRRAWLEAHGHKP